MRSDKRCPRWRDLLLDIGESISLGEYGPAVLEDGDGQARDGAALERLRGHRVHGRDERRPIG
jgi:hypothetical protein